MGKQSTGPASALRDHGMAAAWGFAEATFFFVVPDVWTSWVGLRRPKRALSTTVSALAGAMAGGVVTYRWAAERSPEESTAAMASIPGITPVMVARVDDEVAAKGNAALLRGPSRGVPYKLYARAAGVQRQSLPNFLAWTVPGRMVRFVVVTAAASKIASATRRAFPDLPEKAITGIFVASWGGFYAVFIPAVERRN